MSNIFAGSEIVELGVRIEENGRDFYETLLKQSKSDKAKEIFKFLAGEEQKHIETFKKILAAVQDYQPTESYPGEYFAHMKALAAEHVFTQKDKGREVAKNVKSDKESIELGIKFEKDSIVFYEGMKKVVPAHDHKVVDQVIAQEQNHLKQLTELKGGI